jgi:hypothetical protein
MNDFVCKNNSPEPRNVLELGTTLTKLNHETLANSELTRILIFF